MTDIPTRLVEAAARAIRDHWCSIYDVRGGGWYWWCQCKSGRSVTAPALWEVCAQEVAAHQANAAVAAVFAECEVREEWCESGEYVIPDGRSMPWTGQWRGRRPVPRTDVDNWHPARHLVIITPPETPWEGEGQ